jgi:hypothetical protein
VKAPSTLGDLISLVGEDAVLANYIQYVAYRSVATKVGKLVDDGEEVPELFDLTLPGAMPVFKSGTKTGKYAVPAKFLTEALGLMGVKTKLMDMDTESPEFEKALKVATALRDAEVEAKEKQKALLKSLA